MIRFLSVCFVLISFLILSVPFLPILLLIGKISPKTRDGITRFLVRFMFRLFIRMTGSKVELRGMEKLPPDEAVLFVGNHRSYFDILVTYAYLDRPFGFVAKDGMKKAPILRVWMRFIHCLFLNRTDLKAGLQTINEGAEQIKNGISVFIFPEGTRGGKEGEIAEFKEGSMKIAQKARCKIVPIALSRTAAIWEDNFPKMQPSRVTMEVGDPIDVTTLDVAAKKVLGATTRAMILDMIQQHG